MVKNDDKTGAEGGRRELNRTMKMNTVVDALDLAAATYGVSCFVRPCIGTVLIVLPGSYRDVGPAAGGSASGRRANVYCDGSVGIERVVKKKLRVDTVISRKRRSVVLVQKTAFSCHLFVLAKFKIMVVMRTMPRKVNHCDYLSKSAS